MHSRPAAKLFTRWLIVVALGAAPTIVAAQSSESSHSDDPPPQLTPDFVYALDASMERVLQDFGIPGLAIGIVDNGQPVYMRGFGLRDTRTDQPVNAHTLFHVGPITRTLTATAVLQLVERGELHLTDTVDGSPDTVAQLLTRDDAGFNSLAGLIEATTRQKYPQYVQSRVLDVAGMTESALGVPLVNANVAWPHIGRIFVRRAARYPWSEDSAASTGLSASVADTTRWAALNVNRGPALLTEASYDAMIKPQRHSANDNTWLALGWELEKRGDQWLPRQSATGQGFSTHLTLYPAQRRAIVILANGETAPNEQIRAVIESILAGQSYVSPKLPLFLRSDFRWAFGGLIAMSLLLIAVNLRYRRQRQPL